MIGGYSRYADMFFDIGISVSVGYIDMSGSVIVVVVNFGSAMWYSFFSFVAILVRCGSDMIIDIGFVVGFCVFLMYSIFSGLAKIMHSLKISSKHVGGCGINMQS